MVAVPPRGNSWVDLWVDLGDVAARFASVIRLA
jgi:hypothetical protein